MCFYIVKANLKYISVANIIFCFNSVVKEENILFLLGENSMTFLYVFLGDVFYTSKVFSSLGENLSEARNFRFHDIERGLHKKKLLKIISS